MLTLLGTSAALWAVLGILGVQAAAGVVVVGVTVYASVRRAVHRSVRLRRHASVLAAKRMALTAVPAIEAEGIDAGYHGHPIVRSVSIQVAPGEVVALLGANGAGKTTTLLTLAGEVSPLGGEVLIDGTPVYHGLGRRARDNGVAFIPERRAIFPALTVRENLRVGLADIEPALEIFAELRPLLNRRAGLLSGGEQQMLIVARALARQPRIVLADELSLGLAPLIVARLHATLRAAADRGVAVLIVEQHVRQALKVADRVYVMRRGEIVLTSEAATIDVDELEHAYLATA